MDWNGAARLPGGLVVVGSNREANGGARDGAVLRADDASTRMVFLGGGANDQLFAVASRDDRFCTVGITRSFRGTDQGNHGLLVFGGIDGALTIRRHRIAGDEAVEPRAVSAHGAGWAVAGRHLNGGRFYVAILADDGEVVRARSYRLPGTGTQVHTPRGITSVGNRLLVTGDLDEGGVTTAFLVDVLDDANMTAQAVAIAGTGAALDDATHHAGRDIAVGAVDGAGFVLVRDPLNGTIESATRITGQQVAAVLSHDGAVLAVLNQGNALLAGVLDDNGIAGARHDALRRPAFFGRVPMFADGTGVTLVGKPGGTQVMRELPLGSAFEGACSGGVVGNTQVVASVSSGAPIATPTLLSAALTIATDTLSDAVVTDAPSSQAACP